MSDLFPLFILYTTALTHLARLHIVTNTEKMHLLTPINKVKMLPTDY